jgi:hypothetical protein
VDFSDNALVASENRWKKLARKIEAGGDEPAPQAFMDALENDLNTSKALSFLEANPASLKTMAKILGLTA